MDRIIKGIMKYRNCRREEMVKQFQRVRDYPEVRYNFFFSKSLLITCGHISLFMMFHVSSDINI